jgi:hypothetical protein
MSEMSRICLDWEWLKANHIIGDELNIRNQDLPCLRSTIIWPRLDDIELGRKSIPTNPKTFKPLEPSTPQTSHSSNKPKEDHSFYQRPIHLCTPKAVHRSKAMTSYIPALTLSPSFFENPYTALLVPLALGNAVAYLTRREWAVPRTLKDRNH